MIKKNVVFVELLVQLILLFSYAWSYLYIHLSLVDLCFLFYYLFFFYVVEDAISIAYIGKKIKLCTGFHQV